MSGKLTSLLKVITSPRRLRMLLSFNHKGYLHDIGWFNAFDQMAPVGRANQPIPWVTYSFIDFISRRLNKKLSVFEFGSGNSTLFYANYAGSVVSVEHDKNWFDKISGDKPDNSEMIYCELVRDGDYCRTPLRIGKKFDIVIVDGRDRVNCCKQAVNAINEGGVIVLDDSERDFYRDGVDFLKAKGFKELALTGISPGLFYRKATSIFYKSDNCLGI